MKQKRRPFQRREPLERQHQAHGQIVCQLARRFRGQCLIVEHRLGQPLADVLLPSHARFLEVIEAEPDQNLGEKGPDIVDRGPVGIVPSEISLLHEVLGLRERAHQPISHGHQVPAPRFEVCFRIRFVNRHRSDHLGMTMNCYLGTPDLDPLASLAVTESIFQGREEPGHC